MLKILPGALPNHLPRGFLVAGPADFTTAEPTSPVPLPSCQEKSTSLSYAESLSPPARTEPNVPIDIEIVLATIAGESMENAPFGHRLQERQQAQQQPQQSVFYPARPGGAPVRETRDSPRKTWQALIIAQARMQSGKL